MNHSVAGHEHAVRVGGTYLSQVVILEAIAAKGYGLPVVQCARPTYRSGLRPAGLMQLCMCWAYGPGLHHGVTFGIYYSNLGI